MALTQPDQSQVARKWAVTVNTGTLSSEVWTPVKGLSEFTFSPFSANIEDDGVFDDSGYGSSVKTSLVWTAELSLIRRKTVPAGAFDVGQEKLRTHAMTLGPSGVAAVQIYDRDGGTEAFQGFCEVQWEPDGGKLTDIETVKVTLSGKGAMTTITNPAAGS